MCSDLCKRKLVDAVLSEDTDVLAYGSPIFLTKINTQIETCVTISFAEVLEGLNLTAEQFLDLCIMFGCDYNKNIPKVGPETSYKYLLKYETIDGIRDTLGKDVSILNHVRVRDIFQNHPRYELDKIPHCGQPDVARLSQFLIENGLEYNMNTIIQNFIHVNVELACSDEEDEAIVKNNS
jgi:flap endonuclease-1